MSPAPAQTLERLIRSGDVARCLEFFTDMPERERRKLAPLARRLFREREEGPFEPCQRIAVLATASLTEIKRFRSDVLPDWYFENFDAEFRVLENRRPAWLLSWCTWTLEGGFGCWPLVRRLVRDGICPPPDADQYVLSMISGAVGWPNDHSVLDTLRSDPELLDGMVWRLFEIEGNGPPTLPYFGEHPRETAGWSYALRELSMEGRLDRDRLLDASLAALNRDFAPANSRWFSQLYEYLQPTIEERAACTDRYLDLLASPNPPTVAFAMHAFVAIHKAQRLDNTAFVARVEPALYATAKTPVKQALGILSRIADDDPALANETAHLAALALEHTQSDVQTLALDIVERHGDRGDDSLRAAVAERAPLMAPPLRARAAPAADPGGGDADCSELAALRARAAALPTAVADRSGVAIALAELDTLSGTLAAPYESRHAPLAPRMRIRLSRQSFLWPIWLFFSPLIVFYRLTTRRDKFAWHPMTEAELRLDYVLRSMSNSFLRSFRPHIPQSSFARFSFEMLALLDFRETPYTRYFEAREFLGNPDRLLTDKSVLLLTLRFNDAAASWSQCGIDTLIRLIEDGRLDGPRLGEEMHILLAIGAAKPNRLAERLAVVAAETPLHAQVVRNALQHALVPMPATRPHNIHALFDLLLNLCFEAQETMTNDDCRAFLESFTGTSMAARLARQVLALKPGDPLPHRRAAAAIAPRGRLARAESLMAPQAAAAQ